MQKIVSVLIAVALCVVAALFCFIIPQGQNTKIFRLHIRANSNLAVDQEVKMQIKEDFVEFLTPLVASCTTKEQVIAMCLKVLGQLDNIANNVLISEGFNYTANTKVCNEYFPERMYGDKTVPCGYYDALICELGEAQGDNWWCVVYPPLCFAGGDCINVQYKSKIQEIIAWFFRQEGDLS